MLEEKYIIEVSRYTRWMFCRIGHYRIYCLSKWTMYNVTKDFANFYKRKYDRRWCISIKEWWKAWDLQIAEMIRNYYWLGTQPVSIYTIWEI